MPAPDPPRRIGILGGTFDPPHVGHVVAARAVLEQLALDRLLLVVANDPWQKSTGRHITPAEDRYAMTVAMAGEVPGAEASRLEIDRGGPSYSFDTVEAVRRAEAELAGPGQPVPEIYLVVGADLVPELDTWHRAEDLQRLVTVAAVSRPPGSAATHGGGTPGPPPGWRVVRVEGPDVAVSSSEVRERLAEGRSVEGLVPPAVIHCIRRQGLYAVG